MYHPALGLVTMVGAFIFGQIVKAAVLKVVLAHRIRDLHALVLICAVLTVGGCTMVGLYHALPVALQGLLGGLICFYFGVRG